MTELDVLIDLTKWADAAVDLLRIIAFAVCWSLGMRMQQRIFGGKLKW